MATDEQKEQAIELMAPVEQPSYTGCLAWMQALPETTSRTFDFWNRGNFVRRLLYNRAQGVHPILVPSASVDQLRLTYRRLALAGVPVDFLYTGPISPPRSIMHLFPCDEVPIDAGWGYVIVAERTFRSPTGRDFAPLSGAASLLPEEVTRWVAKEASRPFQEGRLTVAPVELAGLSAALSASRVDALAEVSAASAVADVHDSMPAIVDLEMPWVDGMTPSDFEKLLSDHKSELEDFRSAFGALMSGYYASATEAEVARERFRASVDELLRSARHDQMRRLAAKCRGTVTSFPFAMGMLAAAGAASSADPFSGTAVLAGAAKVLYDLWRQAKSEAQQAAGSLRFVLRLGRPKSPYSTRSRRSRVARDVFPDKGRLHPCHWLCPPTSGLRALVQVD